MTAARRRTHVLLHTALLLVMAGVLAPAAAQLAAGADSAAADGACGMPARLCRPAPPFPTALCRADAILIPALDAAAALALLELKAQLPAWGFLTRSVNLTGWRQEEASAGSGACSWTFVVCDDSGRVSHL